MAWPPGAGYRPPEVSEEPESDVSVPEERAASVRAGTSKLEALGVVDGGEEFVGRLVRLLRRQGIYTDLAEMMAFGRAGLVEAADRFDPAHGSDFFSFAFCRVRGAIIDGVRKSGLLSRRGYDIARAARALGELHDGSESTEAPERRSDDAYLELRERLSSAVTAMTVALYSPRPLVESMVSSKAAPVDESLAELQLRKLVGELLAELPEPERGVLRKHYVDDENFETIAGELGLSRSWVSRIHARGVRRLGLRVRASL